MVTKKQGAGLRPRLRRFAEPGNTVALLEWAEGRGIALHTVPKNASTSMIAAIPEGTKWQRATLETPLARLMFVRHPVERLLSVWRYFVLGPFTGPGIPLVNETDDDLRTFEQFVEFAIRHRYLDRHFLPQVFYGSAEGITLVPFERLKRTWNAIRLAWPALGALPHERRSEGPSLLIDPGLQARIRSAYAADFKLYERAHKEANVLFDQSPG